ncbi:unnamed protein product [Rotaria socialis]|uniref:LITAF domain-containing protein n=1 Tax=Rotaria socialis TaxID=392032 RepID=A0A817QF10_9BILA|nr:unnamed protein product [Rotaria socialis]CAF3424445.1 unnamed protein product [Rotaria socialis]CAF3476580.1 unnamed protein product [Rotaria socialis]CAF3505968.1 unnamed protein product [Rotaria socialis]CAF3578603.1 unnamed protein product [Rotaria socialis]
MSSNDYKGNYQEKPPSFNPVQQPLPITTPTAPAGKYSLACICPYCRQSIVTRVEKSNGLVPWLCASTLFLIGCVFGCCLVPFFMDSCKDVTHYCPNCNTMIRQKKLI